MRELIDVVFPAGETYFVVRSPVRLYDRRGREVSTLISHARHTIRVSPAVEDTGLRLAIDTAFKAAARSCPPSFGRVPLVGPVD